MHATCLEVISNIGLSLLFSLNIQGDGQKLFRDYNVQATNLVDLAEMARQADTDASQHRVALSFLVGKYLKRNLEKGPVRMSNWEAMLNPGQIRCAFAPLQAAHGNLIFMLYRRCE